MLVGGQHYVLLSAWESKEVLCQFPTSEQQKETACLHATKYRSIFVPTHGYRGTLYRVNECILAQDDSLDDMIILQISSIFSTKLSDKYHSFVTGEVYSHAADSSGDPMYHSYSDNPYVEPTSTVKVLRSTAILRKVMLYPDPDMLYNPSKYIVIDYLRPIIPLDKNDVIVPHYPEEGDMISVKGIGSDVYLAHIQSVDRIQKTCQVYFYERDTANISERKYKRVRYAEKVHWSSILGPVTCQWSGKFWIQ